MKTKDTSSTLSHEMLAQDEMNVGLFFASFAIQGYLKHKVIKAGVNLPYFIRFYGDLKISAAQRIFIKEILEDKNYEKIADDMMSLLLESQDGRERQAYLIFLGRINKSFLIRQIFHHTEQILDKYKFISKYINLNIRDISFKDLMDNIWMLSIEQQILILARIFVSLKDKNQKGMKTIKDSFKENLMRLEEKVKENPSKYKGKEFENIKDFKIFLNKV